MRIYTPAGDLAHRCFTFPDGQPHFKLETHDLDFRTVTIETAIKSPAELFQILLATSVLRSQGYSEIQLDIRYLLGARMDRAISPEEPFTLESVARIINSCGFSRVRILDAHSEVAPRLIRNAVNVLPLATVYGAERSCGSPAIIIPDKGAIERFRNIFGDGDTGRTAIYCTKQRDPATGNLSKFVVPSEVPSQCLIIDDICDGGGTFVGLAKELRKSGAKTVSLFVTHGIFSKGLPLEDIDRVFTTDSYHQHGTERSPIGTQVTCIPISMKDIK